MVLSASLPLYSLITASLFLVAGLVDDLRTKKVHNWLILTMVGIGLVVSLVFGGQAGLLSAVLGLLAGVVTFLPLVLTKMVGAGDMKLLAAFGCATNWNAVLSVAFFALIWGALFGVLRAFLQGRGKQLAMNTFWILKRKNDVQLELHSMPFTVAFVFAWLTYLTYGAII